MAERYGNLFGTVFGNTFGSSLGGGFIAAFIMDSNGITKGTNNSPNNNSISEHGVDTDFSQVTVNEKIADTGGANPVDTQGGAFTTLFGPVPLRSHFSTGTSQRFGVEITFGRRLYAIDPRFSYVTTCAITSAELHTHWLPTATFPSVGDNFYTIEKKRLKALEASTGRTVKVIVCDLGANDANNSTPANAMQTNMGTMVTQLHADFPEAVIIWPQLCSATTFGAFVATVRTKQQAFAATAPSYFFAPNIDYATLADTAHWDNATALTIGTQLAEAAREVLGIAPTAVTGRVNFIGYGVTKFGSAGTHTADANKSTQDKDIELLIGHGGGLVASGVPALSDPAGWTKIIDRTTTAGIINSTWKVWWRKVPSGEIATDTIANIHDRSPPQATVTFTNAVENTLKRLTFRGIDPDNLVVDVSTSDIFNTNNTGPKTISGVTTTADGDEVLYLTGGTSFTSGPTVTSFTASGLANVTLISDTYFSMPDTTHTLLSFWKGTKTTAGSTGTASVSFNNNVLAIDGVIAFKS